MTDADWLAILKKDRQAWRGYADWLEEQGRAGEAYAHREMATKGYEPCFVKSHLPGWCWFRRRNSTELVGDEVYASEEGTLKDSAYIPESLFLRMAGDVPNERISVSYDTKEIAKKALIRALARDYDARHAEGSQR